MPLVSPLTIDDFERLPDSLAYYHELVDGELVEALGNTGNHISCGTKETWILEIDSRRAFVFSDEREAILDENGIFESSLIPGFSIRLGDLFDRL